MKRKFCIVSVITACSYTVSFNKHETAPNESIFARDANRIMWDHLHLGNYDSIPAIVTKLKKAYYDNPKDPKINAHLGFVYLWNFCERGRKSSDLSVVKSVYLSNHYFKEAIKLNSRDPRIYGFQSATEICQGAIAENPGQIVSGYIKGLAAIKKWPQFNRFALSFVESQLDTTSLLYKQGMKFQWQLIDECSCRKLNKKTILASPKTVFTDLINELQSSQDPKVKRACWNSWIAPHNFEGFLLNFGDMLVKQGKAKEAKEIYSAARLSPSFNEWVYKNIIDERIKNVEANEKIFNKKMKLMLARNERQLFINSGISCVACHQMSKEEFRKYGYQEPGDDIYFLSKTIK